MRRIAMSKDENPIIEGFLTRMIDRIGRKVAAKAPKLGRLKSKLKKQEAELEKMISDLYGGYDKIPSDVKKTYGIK